MLHIQKCSTHSIWEMLWRQFLIKQHSVFDEIYKRKRTWCQKNVFFTILWDDDVTWWWFLGISILSERFSFKKGNLIRKWRDSWTLFINNLVSWRNCKKELLKKHRILRKNSQKIKFNVKIAYFLLNFSIELN